MEFSKVTSARSNHPTDTVLPETRLILLLLIPFLVLAFLVLYFVPGESSRRFSWEINPAVQATFMGSGYLGGAYLFLQAVVRPIWHRVSSGLPAVTVFATSMLLITILHWERFDLSHFPFQLWLILYIAAPILVPILYLRNRSQDPLAPTIDARIVPQGIRMTVVLVAVPLAVVSVAGYVYPDILAGIWPWALTALSGRVMAGWLMLLAVGGMTLSREPRWSAWRVPLESMLVWFVLFLAGAFVHRADMQGGVFLNWFTGMFILGLAGMLWVYFFMTALVRHPLPPVS